MTTSKLIAATAGVNGLAPTPLDTRHERCCLGESQRNAGVSPDDASAAYDWGMKSPSFDPLVAGWFADSFGEPTDPQRRGWPPIAAGRNTLIAAPTGSGKTLAAFLVCIDDLVRRCARARWKTRPTWSTSRP